MEQSVVVMLGLIPVAAVAVAGNENIKVTPVLAAMEDRVLLLFDIQEANVPQVEQLLQSAATLYIHLLQQVQQF